VVLDEEHEQFIERVAAIDVAKDSGKVCVRVPRSGSGGRRVSTVWDVRSTTNAVTELGVRLLDQGIEKITLESTGDYWRIFYYVLEAAGLDVQLVNARDVKNVPGRPKTDKLDAIWLAKLTERGLLRPSFVPPAPIRELRDYTRMRVDLTRERTRYWQRLEKLLEDSLIKVSSVASKLDTVSARDMIEALIAGERDPHVLARLARGRMKAKHHDLVQALTGRFDAHHGELARMILDQIDTLTGQISKLGTRIEQLIDALPGPAQPATPAPPAPCDDGRHDDDDAAGGGNGGGNGGGDHPVTAGMSVVERLAGIPGISIEAAQVIVAETGTDMSVFATPGHLVSWAKLSPRTVQSGPRSRGGKTGKGNPYLKGVLGNAAAAVARSQNFYGARYRRLVKRRGKLKALVAVARSILVTVWHLLADPAARYHELGAGYHESRQDKDKKTRNHVRQLQAMGYTVTLATTAA